MKKITLLLGTTLALGALVIPAFSGEKRVENNTITAIEGVQVGQKSAPQAMTGVTVIRFAGQGAIAAADVRGSAPGTRETDLLDPVNLVHRINALVLSGGSAWGLDAASGVMRCLEEKGLGFPVGKNMAVPIVPAAVLFDLSVGNYHVRPTAEWGYESCIIANSEPVASGNVGAGTGATTGKAGGMEKATKGGIGSALLTLPGGEKIGALIAVNSFGEIRNSKGEIIAGVRNAEKGSWIPTLDLLSGRKEVQGFSGKNTTIGVIITDVALSKTQLNKVAQMAHDGMARAIFPSHTMYDGDTLFAVSTAQEEITATPAEVNLIGAAAADVTAAAIVDAVKSADSLGGFISATEWSGK
jgi:L-aminopeptidase/D-esterase-like protein